MPGLLRLPAACPSSCVVYAACAVCLLAVFVRPCSTLQESYDEELLLTPLPGGALHAFFQFTHDTARVRHHFTFPKAITQVAAAVPFTEAQVSLTQGRWHSQKWGVAPIPVKPTGAEVQGVFPAHLSASQVMPAWVALAHALGGLLCASLHTLAHPSQTAQLRLTPLAAAGACHSRPGTFTADLTPPPPSSAPDNSSGSSSSGSSEGDAGGIHLAAALPQEAVCTENLTPWLKLLPCRDAAGLASLLKREAVLLADYHSLSIAIHATRDAAGNLQRLQLRQTLALVLRPMSGRRAAADAARRLPPLTPGRYSSWDLSFTFGGPIKGACPVARASRVHMALPGQHVVQQLQPQWAHLEQPPQAEGQGQGQREHSQDARLLRQLLHLDAAAGGDARGPTNSTQPDNSSSGSVRAWSNPLFSLQPVPHEVLVRTGPNSPGTLTSEALPTADVAVQQRQALQQVVYAYDLHAWQQQLLELEQRRDVTPGNRSDLGSAGHGWPSSEEAPPVAPSAARRMNIKLKWQAAAAGGAQPLPSPAWVTSRRTSGSGTMVGAMVLTLQRPRHPQTPPLALQSAPRDLPKSPGSQPAQEEVQGQEGGGQELVCVVQVVPWMVRAWLHTLQLTLDGKEVHLEQLLVQQHISPALDRQRPLVWEVCLALPAASRRCSLQVTFTKAFLTLQEQPPDAYRGFDVPAALVTHRPIPPSCWWNSTRNSGGLQQLLGCIAQEQAAAAVAALSPEGSGTGWWRMGSGGLQERAEVGALLGLFVAPRCSGQVYSPDLLVPLAVPDFSMPYNVICLTSTVLAVYVGSTLNALLRRSSEAAGLGRGPSGGLEASRQRRRKVVQVVVVALVFGGLGVYLDPDQRAAAAKALQPVLQGLGIGSDPGGAAISPV